MRNNVSALSRSLDAAGTQSGKAWTPAFVGVTIVWEASHNAKAFFIAADVAAQASSRGRALKAALKGSACTGPS